MNSKEAIQTSINEFDAIAEIGDIIIVVKAFFSSDNNNIYQFMGFEPCLYQSSGDLDDYCPKCKGKIILKDEDGKIEKDCFRSTDNYIQGKLIKSFIKEEEFMI